MGDEMKKTGDVPLGKIKFGRTKKAGNDSTKTQEQVRPSIRGPVCGRNRMWRVALHVDHEYRSGLM